MQIFVVSLKNSVERRQVIEQKLANVDFQFFDADNLRAEPDHFIFSLYDRSKTKKYKGYELTVAELGCFASHVSLWQKSVELNKSILILEDNIEITEGFFSYLPKLAALVEKYGVLKLCNLFESDYKVVEEVDGQCQVVTYLTKPGLGTQGYAITSSAAQRYLDIVPGFFEPVDNFMEHEWRTKQTIYSLNPNLINRAAVVSTIGKRKVKTSSSPFSKIVPEFYRAYVKIRRAIYNKRYK
jgi:glycosyl transferase family 25